MYSDNGYSVSSLSNDSSNYDDYICDDTTIDDMPLTMASMDILRDNHR